MAPRAARILLVDDNPRFVENLTEILADSGYEIRAVNSCAAALEAARKPLDLALIDIKLPDGDGTALAAQLKEAVPECEVILLTGFATLESAVGAVRAGACAYLMKPCATPELLMTIEQALRQVRLHAEKRELTRRAHMAEKLAAVGTLTAGLSHEIRNPLNAAGLQLTVLERRISKLPPETQKLLVEPLVLVRDEIRRLDHILEDFLQFARPRELVPRRVELGPLLQKVLDLLQGEADRRRVRIERLFADAPAVAGDEERLRQVVMNLVLNALQATPDGGWIRLRVRVQEADLDLAVEDSGKGVQPELRDRLFEPFFTTKPSGSGLGLAIVHAIVAQHGGSVWVDRAEGGGALFGIRLPRYLPQREAESA